MDTDLYRDLPEANSFSDEKEVYLFINSLFHGLGKKKKKKARRLLLSCIAEKENTDRKTLSKLIRQKHGDTLPSVDGKPICLISRYLLQPKTQTISFYSMSENEKLVDKINNLSKIYGYSYGGARFPSMRLQTQYCVSAFLEDQLSLLSKSLSLLFEVINRNLHSTSIMSILYHRFPHRLFIHLQNETKHNLIDLFRPDIILSKDNTLKITEIESAPGGQGILSIHELLINNQSDLLEIFSDYLNGRPYRVIICKDWLDYLWEQASFCNILNKTKNIDAKVITTASYYDLKKHASHWKKHNYSGPVIVDPVQHVKSNVFSNTIFFDPDLNNHSLKDCVTFRFGYFNNFNIRQLNALEKSHHVINGMMPYLESKNVLALVHSDALKNIYKEYKLSDEYDTLASLIPYTELLTNPIHAKHANVLKLSGWSEEAWGSRSVTIGSKCNEEQWKEKLANYLNSDSPSIIQRFTPSCRFTTDYIDPAKNKGTLNDARLRITPIILKGRVAITGLTFRADDKVHGATDAVQAILAKTLGPEENQLHDH